MPDSFDPYSEWLGIQGGDRPLDHYSLLGLKRFESDPELITRAAVAAMTKVRRIRPGNHLGPWSKLLDELRASKACLLHPTSKASYDAGLRDQGPASRPASDPTGKSSRPVAKEYDLGLKDDEPCRLAAETRRQ